MSEYAVTIGDRGPDDHGKFRPGLVECMVIGRPVTPAPSTTQHTNIQQQKQAADELMTILPHDTLTQLFPTK